MKIHGVRTSFIEEVHNLGFPDVEVEELIAMRIHGVDAEFLEDQMREYGSDIAIEDVVHNKIMGHSHRH
jgi:hypothetical protein